MKNNSALKLINNNDYTTVVDIETTNKHNNEVIQLTRLDIKDSKRDQRKVIEQYSLATNESITNINLYLEKKYPKNVLAFEKKLRDVVETLITLRCSNDYKIRFCNKTSIAQIMNLGCESTQKNKSISGFLGKPGIGKTITAKNFTRANKALYVSLNRTDFTMHALLSKMLKSLALPNYNKVHNKMMNDIVKFLTSENLNYNIEIDAYLYPPKLIIIDQADYLSLDAVDVLRTISEDSGVGLSFLGLPNFTKKLENNRAEIKQLKDRISLLIELPDPTFEDICSVLDLNWPGLTDELKKEFFKYSRKTFRLLSHLINHVREDIYSEENLGTELTVDHIRAAAGYLPKAINDEE